jgi:opacity protein-like surface antigen
MKQVALLTAAAVMAAGSTFAIDGAYLGVQGGYQSINNKQSGNAAGVGFSDTHNISGGVLGLYGGYGKTFSNHVYLGGELEANGSSAHSDRGMGSVASKFKQDYNYGASARVGYNMNDCLISTTPKPKPARRSVSVPNTTWPTILACVANWSTPTMAVWIAPLPAAAPTAS